MLNLKSGKKYTISTLVLLGHIGTVWSFFGLVISVTKGNVSGYSFIYLTVTMGLLFFFNAASNSQFESSEKFGRIFIATYTFIVSSMFAVGFLAAANIFVNYSGLINTQKELNYRANWVLEAVGGQWPIFSFAIFMFICVAYIFERYTKKINADYLFYAVIPVLICAVSLSFYLLLGGGLTSIVESIKIFGPDEIMRMAIVLLIGVVYLLMTGRVIIALSNQPSQTELSSER